jgi:type IV pilus assembly protein PilM
MASGAAWGIDIGQCALKALRCRAHENPKKVVAEAFDYIEYPKILSQPGSDPAEMIADALKQFLSRNSVQGDRVAVSVSGQAGLARFIKLPPLEAKKIPDLVRYEARQQIPFDLNDVVWDYQRMGGGSVEEGFALDTEIGLFAMKRDAVFRALDPFLKLDIDVDIVQLTPLVLYNFLVFDQMSDLPPPEEFDSENPPESVVIISMGTDATDLVVTNGFRVWQRSIPLGGSHFTKALTRELKLTFAKAEHLKRNATTASDPKAVFQAMKPVFSDLLTELQRSIGYFSNLDRAAKIGRIVALGNAMKLPGLRRYLSQSLGYDIEKIDSYQGLEGAQVISSPSFQENLLSFGVSYGLALQGLGKGAVHTNLLPKEIVQGRLINRKKPWAVAAAALLLLGCSISYAAYSMALGGVEVQPWQQAQGAAKQLKTTVGNLNTADAAAKASFGDTTKIGQELVANVEDRIRWLELLKAINACLPHDDPPAKPDAPPIPIAQRRELHVTNIDCQQVDDEAAWVSSVQSKGWEEPAVGPDGKPLENAGGTTTEAAGGTTTASAGNRTTWVVQLRGHHWHNADPNDMGPQFVRSTLLKALREKVIELPTGENGQMEKVSMAELGISHPVLVNPLGTVPREVVDPNVAPTDSNNPAGGMGRPMGGMGQPMGAMGQPMGAMGAPMGAMGQGRPRQENPSGAPAKSASQTLDAFDFIVMFCWKPTTPQERHEAKKPPEKTDTQTPQ